MCITKEFEQKVYAGSCVTRDEALLLAEEPLEELTAAANRIRETMCGNRFDMCTIINGK